LAPATVGALYLREGPGSLADCPKPAESKPNSGNSKDKQPANGGKQEKSDHFLSVHAGELIADS
jgi:hypothetical protein